MKAQLGGIALVVNVDYHYNTLKLLELFNILNVGLCDVAVEPWLCWYPIFCRGSDKMLQHLFLLFTVNLKINGLNYRTRVTRNYMYLLSAELSN
jgi:hypothetical protein